MMILKLFFTFFKIGLLGFGGGMAILPLIYQSVLSFSDMEPETFANLFAISQATPGPIAVNAATFVGFQTAGLAGAAAATIGVAVPSFILVAIVFHFIHKYHDNPLVEGAFKGIRPATVGMIASAVVFMGENAVFKAEPETLEGMREFISSIDPIPAVMVLATVILASFFKVGAVKLIVIMGVLGAFLCSGMFF